MKVRAINTTIAPSFDKVNGGVSVISVGDFVHYVNPGDGLILYCTQDDHITCDFSKVCLVVSLNIEEGSITVDSRSVEMPFNPDSHALSKWRKNPYLAPDKAKVKKYGFLDLFADAFGEPSLSDAPLEDCSRYVFKPDLTIPTLNYVEGFVYLFERPDLHKIGKTTDLSRRHKELERQHGLQLTLIHSFQSRDYTRAEGELLAKYRPKLREGAEWFALDQEDIKFICSIADYGMDS
jgi:hypothetical protein